MTPEPQLGRAAALVVWAWLSRGVKVIVLLAAAALLADVLFLGIGLVRDDGNKPLVRPEAERKQLQTPVARSSGDWSSTSAPWPNRTLSVAATSTQITFTFEVTIPKSDSLAQGMASGYSPSEVPALCRDIFGLVKVNDRPLNSDDFQLPLWTTTDEQSMRIRITAIRRAEPVSLVEIGDWRSKPPRPVCDQFELLLNEVQLRHINPIPDRASDTEVVFGLETLKRHPAFNFTIATFDSAERQAESASNDSMTTSRQSYLMRVGGLIDFPFIGNILFSIVKVFPVLIFIVIASVWRPETAPSDTRPLVERMLAVLGGLLVLHFSPYFLAALGDICSTLQPFANRISDYVYASLSVQGPWRIAPAVIGILVTASLFERARMGGPNARSRWVMIALWIVGLGLLVGIAATIAFYFGSENETNLGLTQRTSGWFLIGGGTLLLWLTLRLAMRQVAKDPSAADVGATLLVLGVVALQNSWGITYEWRPRIFLVSAIVLGTALLVALARMVSVRLFATEKPFTGGWRWAVRAGAFLLALPIGVFVATQDFQVTSTMLMDFAFRLGQLVTLLFVVALLFLLREQGKHGAELDPFTRFVGILGAGAIFFPAITRWMFIPVRFLLGLWLLSLLVRPARFWDDLRAAYEMVVANRHTLLGRLIDLNTAESTHADFRKNLSKKVSAAKITLAIYDAELRQATDQMTELRNRTKIGDRPAKEFTLAFGPYDSAWENALHGTRWGLLFGLPWIGLFVQDYLSASISAVRYPHWDFITDFLNVIVTWAAIGFFFGYFYPYIRGRNGLQKGFTVFVGIVAPALPLMTLFNAHAGAWRSDLFWIVQIFIQCMLVGLVAFDYRIVRRSGFDWPMLLDLHGFTRIGISLSSILAAIGVAITGLLSSQATTLVSNALSMFKPATAKTTSASGGGAPQSAPVTPQ